MNEKKGKERKESIENMSLERNYKRMKEIWRESQIKKEVAAAKRKKRKNATINLRKQRE